MLDPPPTSAILGGGHPELHDPRRRPGTLQQQAVGKTVGTLDGHLPGVYLSPRDLPKGIPTIFDGN